MSNYVPRLKKVYTEKITPELTKEFGYTTIMQVPKLVKIVLSMGVGEALTNRKLLDAAVTDLGTITGQKAVKTKAKKSIANFKLREGHCPALKIFAVLILMDLTVEEITHSALPNKLFSLKLTSIKLKRLQG